MQYLAENGLSSVQHLTDLQRYQAARRLLPLQGLLRGEVERPLSLLTGSHQEVLVNQRGPGVGGVGRHVEELALVLHPVTGVLHLPPGGDIPHHCGVTVQA